MLSGFSWAVIAGEPEDSIHHNQPDTTELGELTTITQLFYDDDGVSANNEPKKL